MARLPDSDPRICHRAARALTPLPGRRKVPAATSLIVSHHGVAPVSIAGMAENRDDPGPSVKDDEMYEKLREEGNSKRKSARIANAAATGGRSAVGLSGGKHHSYAEWTVEELRDRAREIGVEGRSTMTKDELIEALRDS